jgi:hypothetical protein
MTHGTELEKPSSLSNLAHELPGSASRNFLQPTRSTSDIFATVAGLSDPAGVHSAERESVIGNDKPNASVVRDLPNGDVNSTTSGVKEIGSARNESPASSQTQDHAESPLQRIAQGQNPIEAQFQSQQESMPAIEKKPGLAGSARTSGQTTPRAAQAASTLSPAEQQGHPPPVAQPDSSALDGSTLSRTPAGSFGAGNTAGDIAATTAGTPTIAGRRETFAALDAQAASGTPTWIHAGSQRAEAGFQDPALGWVSVRAGLSGGGIHAALVPDSADAAQALGGHMAGLNAYLAEHHTPVETLTLAAPDGRAVESAMDQNAGQNMQQGAGQSTGQNAGQQSSTETGVPAFTAATIPAQARGQDVSTPPSTSGGLHISVMA